MAVYKSKKITKDGRSYFFRIKYKDIFGEVHDYTSPKFKNKKDAEFEEARYRLKVESKTAFISDITFNDIFNELISKKETEVKKQTIIKIKKLYEHLHYFENKKINDINVANIKEFTNILLTKNMSVPYNNKILGLLRQIIIYSAKFYGTSDSILKYIDNFKKVNVIEKEMDFYTYSEYKQFDNVIKDHGLHTFFEILYFLGLRKGECQALTWEDISFERKELTINKTLTTKIKGEMYTISSPKTKNSIRTLPIPEKIINDLKTMKSSALEYKDFSKKWFVFGNVFPYRESTLEKKKNEFCKQANIKQIRIHDFRHSCASLLINKGATIALVSKYLGHSNITITLNTYTHMYKSELENVTELLNNL